MPLTSHPAATFCYPALKTRDRDGANRFSRFATLAHSSDAPFGVFPALTRP